MRLFQISYVLAKYLVFYRVTKHRHKIFGERLKYACADLGLTFIKIGQVLSMRYDLLSAENREPLKDLLDRTNALSFETVTAIIAKEYGKPHTHVFNTFNRQPLGSASVSQVHKATLNNGRVVAVKVKRPAVDKYVRTDIRIIKRLVRMAMLFSSTLRDLQALEFVVLFEQWMEQDSNFRLEAINIRKLREQSLTQDTRKSHYISCMDVVEELCTENVIVMDFVEGIPVSDSEKVLQSEKSDKYNLEQSVRSYINASVDNWFRDDLTEYLFQADPHFSNIIALPHGRVANIDCGLVSSLSKTEMANCKALILAIFLKDAKKIARIATHMGNVDYEKHKRALEYDFEEYLEKTDGEGIGYWFFEFTKILAKNKIKYPFYLITLGRANLIIDGLVEAHIPGHTTLDLLGEQLRGHALKEFMSHLDATEFIRAGYMVFEHMRKSSSMYSGYMRRIIDTFGDSMKSYKAAD